MSSKQSSVHFLDLSHRRHAYKTDHQLRPVVSVHKSANSCSFFVQIVQTKFKTFLKTNRMAKVKDKLLRLKFCLVKQAAAKENT